MVKKLVTTVLGLMLAIGASAQMGNGNDIVPQDSIRFWTGTGSNRAVIAITWDDETAGAIGLAWGVQWNGSNIQLLSLMDTIAAYDSRFTFTMTSGGTFINNMQFVDNELGLNLSGEEGWWWYNWYGAGGVDLTTTSGGATFDMIGNGHFIDWLQTSDADVMLYPSDPNAVADSPNYPFSASNVQYWAGSGSNSAVVSFGFGGTLLVYGVRWNGNVHVDTLLNIINNADSRMTIDGISGGYISFMEYNDPSTNTLYEESGTGWMYKVNNVFASSINTQSVSSGDYVHFSDDFGFTVNNYVYVTNPNGSQSGGADSVHYWVGTGNGSATVAVAWDESDVALLWGVHYDDEYYPSVIDLLDSIAAYDSRFDYHVSYYMSTPYNISSITYNDGELSLSQTNTSNIQVRVHTAFGDMDGVSGSELEDYSVWDGDSVQISTSGMFDFSNLQPVEAPTVPSCLPIELDGTNTFVETFDTLSRTGSGVLPACWNTAHVAGSATSLWTSYSTTSADASHSGNRVMQLPDQQSGNITRLVSPAFNITNANQYQVSLWVKRTNEQTGKTKEGVKVWANHTPDTVGGTLLFHARRSITQAPAVSAAGWYEYTGVVPMDSVVYIVIEGISEYGTSTYIDDFSMQKAPLCDDPEDLYYDAVSGSVTWTAGSATQWQVRDGDDLFIVDEASYSNANWAAASTYTVSVRSICGAGDTNEWRSSVTFRTPCSSTLPLPYINTFSGYDYSLSPFYANAPLPDCWTVLSNGTNVPNAASDASVYFSGIGVATSMNNYGCVTVNDPYFSFMAYAPYDGTYETYINNMNRYGTRKFAVLPGFGLPLSTLMLSFDYSMSAKKGAELHVGYVVNDTADFTSLYVVPTSYRLKSRVEGLDFGVLDNNIPDGARLAMMWITTDTVHTGTAPANYFCGIDNMVVEDAPTCKYPRDVVADSIGFHGFSLAWRDVSSDIVSQWDVMYGPKGFDPDEEGSVISTSSSQAVISNLTADSYYDVYVRSRCGANSYSDWTEPITVRTACPQGGNVILGTEELSDYTVAFSNWGNTVCQSIFTAQELSAAGLHAGDTVSNLVYNWQNGTQTRYVKAFSIYMTHTAVTEFPQTPTVSDWLPVTASNLVYSDSIRMTVCGETRYDLATPFVWNGTDGIAITTLVNQPSEQSSTGFYALSSSSDRPRTLFHRRDRQAYAIADLSTETPSMGMYRANVFVERPCIDTTAQEETIPDEATIAASDILYWVGEGSNQAIMAVNWADTALAWGYRWNGTATVATMMADIAAADPRFSYTGTGFVNDIMFNDGTVNLAITPGNYWGSTNNGVMDMGMGQTLADGDFEKWGDPAAGVVVDSMESYGYMMYTYVYPMTIHPVSVPGTTVPAEATIAASDILYWVGEGTNKVVFAVDWVDSALAWGYKFSSDSVTVETILDAIAAADPRFSYSAGWGVNDIRYFDSVGGMTDTLHLQGDYWMYNVNGTPAMLGFSSQKVAHGDFVKFGDIADGFGYDYDSTYHYYASYVWTRTVTPVSVPHTGNVPVEATIAASDILYWVGEGSNRAILAVNWADTALAWGYRWNDTATVGEMLNAIAAADPRLSVEGAGLISDIKYIDTAAGMTDTLRVTPGSYWGSTNNGYADMGTAQVLGNGDLEKFADPVTGVLVDSVFHADWNWMEYIYVYPMTIHAVTVPDTTGGGHGPVIPEHGPYCGAAGTEGSTAIAADSSAIVAWATGVVLTRGPQNISVENSPLASYGGDTNAIGMATLDNTMDAVSLGDGGMAVVTFARPIVNGEGPDFAVFENGFGDNALELAFVEVSTDGQRYVRFPSSCLTQNETQLPNSGASDPTNLNNLAGKYRIGFGTPFDLEELRDSTGINIDSIVYVRLVDVVGCINPQFATRDASGRIINDPWPTPFISSGFDLTGVAVMHQLSEQQGIADVEVLIESLYPNPTADVVNVRMQRAASAVLFDLAGRQMGTYELHQGLNTLDLSHLANGVYMLRAEGNVSKIVKR